MSTQFLRLHANERRYFDGIIYGFRSVREQCIIKSLACYNDDMHVIVFLGWKHQIFGSYIGKYLDGFRKKLKYYLIERDTLRDRMVMGAILMVAYM